jgi:hypothetical protein
VVEMTPSAPVALPGSEFDDFLCAPIGEEQNGMLLSVLSALVRLDVDPWQEAAKLAGLPGETATARLASLIAALPDRPLAHLDPRTIAARLIARLPRPPRSDMLSLAKLRRVDPATPSRAVMFAVLLSIAFVLGVECIRASLQTPAPVDDAQASASSAVTPPMPPLDSGQ